MTYKEWERKLLKELKVLPKNEKKEIADYYKEMYGDKLDSGLSEEDILTEFGSPESCAARILSESDGAGSATTGSGEQAEKGVRSGTSVASVLGAAVLSLLLILPLACVGLFVIAIFGATTFGGAIVALAGVAYVIFGPFMTLGGAAITAHIGLGLACCGVGLLLFALFFVLTKYAAIGCYKALVFIYGRRKRQ